MLNSERTVALVRPPTPGYPFDLNEHPHGLIDLRALINSNSQFAAQLIDLAGSNPDAWESLIPDADVYGISVMSPQVDVALALARVLRKRHPDAKIIAGGKHPSARPDELTDHFDVVFQGEADETLLLYLNNLAQGIASERIVVPARAPDLKDYPSYDLATTNHALYGRSILGRKATAFSLSRGCPYRCAFCTAGSAPDMYKHPRMYPDERNVTIIQRAAELGYSAAFLRDDNLLYPKYEAQYRKIFSYLREHDFLFRFNLAAGLASPENMRLAYNHGGRIIDIALESGDPSVLKLMRKPHQPEKYIKMIKAAQDVGLITYTYVIVGFPGETEESIDMTINVLREAQPHFTLVFPFVPYPGTLVGDNLLEWGYEKSTVATGVHVCNRADGGTPQYSSHSDLIVANRIDRISQAIAEVEANRPKVEYESFKPITWDLDAFEEQLKQFEEA